MYFLLQKIKKHRKLVNYLTFHKVLLYNSITYDVYNKLKQIQEVWQIEKNLSTKKKTKK